MSKQSKASEQETQKETQTPQTTESESKDQNSARAKSEREGGDAGGPSNDQITSDFQKVSEAAASGEGVQKRDADDVDDEEKDNPDSAPQAEYELPEGYDPLNDPIVPSSDIAQTIAQELAGTGESATLKALHDARKAAESDDK